MSGHIYPSYFKLHVRWLRSLTRITYLSKLTGFTPLPPACNSNYFGYSTWIMLNYYRQMLQGVIRPSHPATAFPPRAAPE
ncbi:hypothetical protein FDX01_20335 [Citrobacter sp. wls613]|uniref:Uncharacterized protein n=1 Tax=Citrobacter gillenii TaxID=67828 RepID=A0ABD6M8W2_9ENTR|nr:hypothetical protein [Citrobacter gillenii]TKU24614.1 hypothetical protein FDW95_20240 [Citrobacter sp. wls718]TKV18496.1 hypothetical protein FDX01_20335 [Citrobacter sp. wls613]